MSKFNVNHITSKSGKNGPVLAGITTVNSTGAMRIPSGPTENRGGRGRMVFGGGYYPSPHANLGTMDFVEIATLGNASDFGNLTTAKAEMAVTASSTRACISGGDGPGPSYTNYNVIEYVEISTLGNAVDFGDLLGLRAFSPGGASNAHGGLG